MLKIEPRVDQYLNCLNGMGLIQCINKPPRVTDNSAASCLDHIFVRYRDMSNVNAAVLQTSITDHYSTGLTISMSTQHAPPPVTAPHSHATTPHTYTDFALLSELTAKHDWEPLLSCDNVNNCSQYLSSSISHLVNSAKKQKTNLLSDLKKSNLGYQAVWFVSLGKGTRLVRD